MSNSLWDWSATAASNTTVGGVSIVEGMSPANVNNAMRAMMAGLKNAMWGGTTGGTTNAQTLSLGVAPAAYVSGMAIWFLAGATNTGTTTLNVNALGTKNVFSHNAACQGGEIQSGQLHCVVYDGTQFQLQKHNPAVIRLGEQASAPATAANQGALYAQDIGGASLPVWRRESSGDAFGLLPNTFVATYSTQTTTSSTSFQDSGLQVTATPRYSGSFVIRASNALRAFNGSGFSTGMEIEIHNSTSATSVAQRLFIAGFGGSSTADIYGPGDISGVDTGLTVGVTQTYKYRFRLIGNGSCFVQHDNNAALITATEIP